jgi:hypothetical protein
MGTERSFGSIERQIYQIRGHKVMLDHDLARLYGIEVRQLKRQVRRNADRFPPDFMLVLTREEQAILRCQFGTLGWGTYSKYLPYAFTEQGVAMLSSVVSSRQAVQVNIAIMRTFVKLREVLANHKDLAVRLEAIERHLADHGAILGEHAEQIRAVFETIRQLMEPAEKPRRRIGFVPPGDA